LTEKQFITKAGYERFLITITHAYYIVMV